MASTQGRERINLEEHERLTLQNFLLKLTVENERVEKYKAKIAECEINKNMIAAQIENWKMKYHEKLSEMGVDLKSVTLDSETGIVEFLKVDEEKAEK